LGAMGPLHTHFNGRGTPNRDDGDAGQPIREVNASGVT
jgi:hypothetical protein